MNEFRMAVSLSATPVEAQMRPNIILIYLDDLGSGDSSAYSATAIKTPAIDRLAKGGLRFTSGYASSATCAPSRLSLLAGRYAWRQAGTNVLPGNAALVIDPARARTRSASTTASSEPSPGARMRVQTNTELANDPAPQLHRPRDRHR